MQSKVLGISASPQRGGKVDTLVQEILSATRLPHELVRLHALTLRPCRACNACRTENVCTLEDDWNDLSDRICDAHALVIGGWAFAGMLDAATKLLMERFWSLRHRRQLARGKVGAAVVVGANPELAGTLADALLQFMRNNGMNPLGRVTGAGANPCLGCEDALQDCEYSGVVTQYGLLERVGASMYNPIEQQLAALKSARILGQRIGHKARHLQARGVGVVGGPGDETFTGRAGHDTTA
jgi:multimeric flavodoxin WrbA